MSFISDIEKYVKGVAGDIQNLGDDLAHDIKNGASTLESDIQSLKNKLEQEGQKLETDFENVLAQVTDAWKKYADVIDAIRKAVPSWIGAAASTTALSNLEPQVKSQQADSNTWQNISNLQSSLVSQTTKANPNNTDLTKFFQDFDTFSYAFSGEVAAALVADGTCGYAIKMKKQDYRFVADVAAGIGEDLDVDLSANAGFWCKSPHDMKGAYIAAQASAADAVGVAVAAVCDFPSMDLIGFVFGLEAGEGITLDARIGYTMTWKPSAATASANG